LIQLKNINFAPIGIVHSPFQEKFAIPRQSGLTKIDAVIEMLPPFAQAEAVSELEQFSHLWIVFIFHALGFQSGDSREWKPLVRPPRLGGNEKVGVFATRSTHRPNPIGLSAVELIKIEVDEGVKLHIRGADLLDGTPVLDIKPYIPYADAIPTARAGFAQHAPERLELRWRAEALSAARELSILQNVNLQSIVEETLCFDPRPAYQNEPERIYGVHFAGCNVLFHIDGNNVEIIGIERIEKS
jgi:tRNA (adenine37-N6)-methyltransferase